MPNNYSYAENFGGAKTWMPSDATDVHTYESINKTRGQIVLRRSLIIRTLWVTAAFLISLSIGLNLVREFTGDSDSLLVLLSRFDVDKESNIPTFFSSSLLFFAALLLFIICVLKRKARAPFVLHWTILALGFLYLAVDESARLHELLIGPTKRLLGGHGTEVFYLAPWVLPGIVVTLGLGLSFMRFLLHLPLQTRLLILIAGTLYVGGSLGLELIGGSYSEHYGMQDLRYIAVATVEETFEMAGVIIFVRALLDYIQDCYGEVRFRWEACSKSE